MTRVSGVDQGTLVLSDNNPVHRHFNEDLYIHTNIYLYSVSQTTRTSCFVGQLWLVGKGGKLSCKFSYL